MYNRGNSSRMDAILKNQFRHVSFAVSGTMFGVNLSGSFNTCPLNHNNCKQLIFRVTYIL